MWIWYTESCIPAPAWPPNNCQPLASLRTSQSLCSVFKDDHFCPHFLFQTFWILVKSRVWKLLGNLKVSCEHPVLFFRFSDQISLKQQSTAWKLLQNSTFCASSISYLHWEFLETKNLKLLQVTRDNALKFLVVEWNLRTLGNRGKKCHLPIACSTFYSPIFYSESFQALFEASIREDIGFFFFSNL
jgi:hypothetical protein